MNWVALFKALATAIALCLTIFLVLYLSASGYGFIVLAVLLVGGLYAVFDEQSTR